MEAPLSDQSASEQPTIPAPPAEGGGSDSRARQEAEFVGSKSEPPADWNEWAKTNKILREEMLRQCFFIAVSVLMILAAVLLGGVMIVWVWHLVGPHRYRWLEPSEFDKLQIIVFSGAISALATLIGKRILHENDDDDDA